MSKVFPVYKFNAYLIQAMIKLKAGLGCNVWSIQKYGATIGSYCQDESASYKFQVETVQGVV